MIDIVFFYPNRYYDESDDEKSILKLLSALFSSNTNAQTKLSILENDYDILMTKEDRKEFENMCNVSEVFFDRGSFDTLIRNIQNLMDSCNVGVEKTMSMLKVEEKDKPRILEELNKISKSK